MDSTPSQSTPETASLEPEAAPFSVVGVGASAGGLEALTALLRHLPAQPGFALVVVQHLDPTHPSSLAELLERKAKMPIREVTDGTPVEVNHAYVIPPAADLVLRAGVFRLTPRADVGVPHFPIDAFLRSLAEDRADQAVGVILSGTGTDGSLGLKAVRTAGGTTFAQDDSAKFDGMPKSAVAAGCVDVVLPPDGIAAALLRLVRTPAPAAELPPDDAASFSTLFRAVRNVTRVDFAGYKLGTVSRRVQRRMAIHKLDRVPEYARYVEQNPDEARALFEDMLIHVTSFFRDPDVFEALRTDVFPLCLVDRPADSPIRVWVPGCSTGEEVYSLAVALLEFLGDKTTPPIKLFGTDLSEMAVETARAGKYPASIATDVSPDRLRRFFVAADGGYQITQTVRDLCVFARHDVTRDPPFNNMDLVSCRNVLIYLGADLQKRVLPVFHYALKPNGWLLLGTSETVPFLSDLFQPVSPKQRIFSRRPATTRTLLDFASPEVASAEPMHEFHRVGTHAARSSDVLHEADRVALAHAPPGVVVNDSLEVLQIRGDTSPYLELAPGVASLGLLKLVRDGLQVLLRTAIDEARTGNTRIHKEGIGCEIADRPRLLNLSVTPFTVPPGGPRYFLILFEDVTPPPRSGETSGETTSPGLAEAERVMQLLAELATTRSSLQAAIEELEAHNEELHAANEEAVSSNEELRSTNEELQTAKEELQATNEELRTVNEELNHRIRAVVELGNDLTNLLTSVQIPIVMLGPDLRVRRFTPSAVKLFSLIPGDVGRPFGDITSRLDVPNLGQLITTVIDTLAVVERDVQDRDGRWYGLSIRPYRTQDNKIDGAVLSAIDIDVAKRALAALQESETRLRLSVRAANIGLWDWDLNTDRLHLTPEWKSQLGYAGDELSDRFEEWQSRVHPDDLEPTFRKLREFVAAPTGRFEAEFRLRHRDGSDRWIHAEGDVLRDASDKPACMLGCHVDVTERKRAEETLLAKQLQLAMITDVTPVALTQCSREGRYVFVNRAYAQIAGLAPEQIIGKPIVEIMGEEGWAAIQPYVERVLRGEAVDYDQKVPFEASGTQHLSVAYRPHKNEFGEVLGWFASITDVTERRRAEEALRDRELRLTAVLVTAADAIVTIDERGVIDSANPATERMFGYSTTELAGQNVKMLMPPPFRDEHDDYLARYAKTGVKRIIGVGREVQGRRKDGTVFPVELSVSEILDGQRRFTGIIRDITRRKELEREVIESAAEEERRIGRELHDGIGQELTGLGLLADALARQLDGTTGTQRQSAEKLTTGLQRVHEQVRTLCRDLVLAELDAEGLRAALADLAARSFEQSGVACTLECPDPVRVPNPTAAKHLYRIAQEAVTNALRHGKSQHVRIGLHNTPHGLRLSVTDDGTGVANGTNGAWETKGLGVSTMRYRASLIDGTLHIGAAVGGGVLVTCNVPREDDDGETKEQELKTPDSGVDRR